MDPSLMDDTCVCPECLNGRSADTCRRCGNIGYVPCEEIQLGEEHITMSDERSGIFIVHHDDGSITAEREEQS